VRNAEKALLKKKEKQLNDKMEKAGHLRMEIQTISNK